MDKYNTAPAFLMDGGETGALMLAHDWSNSLLGAPNTWPQSLRSVVGLMLHSKFPMFVAWGPELEFLYNDSYAPILGNKHPTALGRRFQEIWSEIWDDIHPIILQAMDGKATYHENLPLIMRRKGYDEPTWFTFSYSPVRDESGTVAGMFCACTETTEQVLTERHRVAENEHLHRLFEQAPGIMTVLRGPSHVFELANTAYLETIGNREIVGKPIREALPELAGQGFFELLDQVYIGGEPYIGRAASVKLQREPGAALEERFIDFVYQPIKNRKGKVTGIFVEGSDVTEAVHTTAALRESEQRLQQLANTIPQLAWMADADGWINWYNERWYAYTGTTLEDMQGWGWQDVHDPSTLSSVMENWKASIATGQPFEMTFPLRSARGEFRHFYTLVAPLRDAAGNIVQWFGTNTDVTALEQAEKAARHSEEKLREGLVAARMVVWEWDLTNGKVRLSDNAKQVFGRTWNTVDTAWSLTHPDDVEPLRKVLDQAIEDGGSYETAVRMFRPDNNETIWVELKGKVLRDAAGKPHCISGVALDITERRRAEEELRIANRRKDEFLAMLAHELRNPLAPISAAAELFKLARLDEARIREASNIIARQVQHMTELVDDLLDVSRVTRGLVKIEKEPLDLSDLIDEAIEQTHSLIVSRQHHLAVQRPGKPAIVNADRTRLIQIFTNILNNAVKYTPAHGSIVVTMGIENEEISVSIRDNGIGIASELQPYVFDLFTQAERSPDRSQGGLGLGLALVKSLVELHDGSVSVQSEGANRGSEFIIRLPRLAENMAHTALSIVQAPVVSDDNALAIMLVDDNMDAARTLAMLLEAHGYSVAVNYTAQSALEQAPLYKPQVWLLDIGLPDMDGYELARRLRTMPDTSKAVMIALTGYGQEQDRERSKKAGFDHHLVKPVDAVKLLSLLAEIHSLNGSPS